MICRRCLNQRALLHLLHQTIHRGSQIGILRIHYRSTTSDCRYRQILFQSSHSKVRQTQLQQRRHNVDYDNLQRSATTTKEHNLTSFCRRSISVRIAEGLAYNRFSGDISSSFTAILKSINRARTRSACSPNEDDCDGDGSMSRNNVNDPCVPVSGSRAST